MYRKKGFTLAELLIVVAIIGVLVAVSIPIFTSQLEKARQATDRANARSARAAATADFLSSGIPEKAVYYYDAVRGEAIRSDQSVPADLTGYGKSSTPGNQAEDGYTGTPKQGGKPGYVMVRFLDYGSSVAVTWQSGQLAVRDIVTVGQLTANGNILYRPAQNDSDGSLNGDAAFDEAMLARINQDISLLDAIQNVIRQMTAGELKSMKAASGDTSNNLEIQIGYGSLKTNENRNYGSHGNQGIKTGYEALFASVGVDVDKIKSGSEILLTGLTSGNKTNIEIILPKKLSSYSDDEILSGAYVYLKTTGDKDDNYLIANYTSQAARKSTAGG